MRRSLLALGALAVVTAGCGPPKRDAREFFPLARGHRWLYEVTKGDGTVTLLDFHILDEVPGDRGERRFRLDSTGERYFVQQGEQFSYSVARDIWTVYLEGPLHRGRRFAGAFASLEPARMEGETVPAAAPSATPWPMLPVATSGYKLVTAFDRRVTVPAGTFDDCLEVTHVTPSVVGVKYFAPGVGLVFAEGWVEDREAGKRYLISRQELVEYRVGGRSGGDASQRIPAPYSGPDEFPTQTIEPRP